MDIEAYKKNRRPFYQALKFVAINSLEEVQLIN